MRVGTSAVSMDIEKIMYTHATGKSAYIMLRWDHVFTRRETIRSWHFIANSVASTFSVEIS